MPLSEIVAYRLVKLYYIAVGVVLRAVGGRQRWPECALSVTPDGVAFLFSYKNHPKISKDFLGISSGGFLLGHVLFRAESMVIYGEGEPAFP